MHCYPTSSFYRVKSSSCYRVYAYTHFGMVSALAPKFHPCFKELNTTPYKDNTGHVAMYYYTEVKSHYNVTVYRNDPQF